MKLLHTALRFRKHFHKNPPRNAVIISFVEKFGRSGSVLTLRVGHSGRKTTVCTNENLGRVLLQVLQSLKKSLIRTYLRLNICKTLLKECSQTSVVSSTGYKLSNL